MKNFKDLLNLNVFILFLYNYFLIVTINNVKLLYYINTILSKMNNLHRKRTL